MGRLSIGRRKVCTSACMAGIQMATMKMLDKARKLQAHADSARNLGNEAEAQAFAKKARELLKRYASESRKRASTPHPISYSHALFVLGMHEHMWQHLPRCEELQRRPSVRTVAELFDITPHRLARDLLEDWSAK